MKSIKLSDYFEIKNPSYVYLKLIPDSSIRNYNTSSIAKSIALMYKTLFNRIVRENKKLIVETNINIEYITHISKNDISFYFKVPSFYKDLIKDKITNIWNKVTVQEINDIPKVQNPVRYNVYTSKQDALSLNVDKKNNSPLNEVLNVLEILKDEEQIFVTCKFEPISQIFWKNTYNKTIDKVKNGRNVDKEITASKVIYSVILFIIDTLKGMLEALFDGTDKPNNNLEFLECALGIIKNNAFSSATEQKKNDLVVNTSIIVESVSNDFIRANNNAVTVCQSMKVLDEDNSIKYKQLKNKNKIIKNILSANECSNFIQLAGRELQEKYNISHIETNESEVPEELRTGTICIGINTFKGNKTNAYLTTDKEFKYLTLCLISPTRGGKTTLLENIANDCIKNNECVINFDFCGKCKLSHDLSCVIPKGNVLDLDCSNHNHFEGIGFNEIQYNGIDKFLKYRSAKEQAILLVDFINNINITSPLEPRMLRYLKASAIICFYQNESTGCVLDILEDHLERQKYVDNVKNVEELKKVTRTLDEINEYGKNGEITGTKLSYVQGILNRADIIRSNTYMEVMLDKNIDKNINFIEEMQKNQLINLKIPENMFKTDIERDIYCLYYLVKIWGALQERMEKLDDSKMVKVNLLIDELYQVPLTQTFLKSKINQIAKKRCKPIISCHSLEQIRYIRPELKSANTSYMLINGCNKDNFKELQEELYPYQLEDLLKLKRYHSLNLMKTENGYATFITKLPKPLNNKG